MTPPYRAYRFRFAILAATLRYLAPSPALAAEAGCRAVVVDDGFRVAFPDLAQGVRNVALARTDTDSCARVELHLENARILLSVTLPDGRTASRDVLRREDIAPTLQALLVVPDALPAPAAPSPSAPPRNAPQFSGVFRTEREVFSPPAVPARRLGFEFSLMSSARVGDGQFGYAAGALSFLEVYGWLIGIESRVDGYRPLQSGDPQTALQLAILAGKRLYFGGVALDLTAGPGVALRGIGTSNIETVRAVMGAAPPPSPHSESSSGSVPRFLVGARLGFSPRSIFRTFIGVDGEWGPAGGAETPVEDGPSQQMPSYTVGIALGTTVGTL